MFSFRVCVFAMVFGFFCFSGCTNFFFLPERAHYLKPSEIGLAFEDRFVENSEGQKLHSWFLPAVGEERGLILFFHGNAQNISTHIASVSWLPAQGYSVLLADYRGYGMSEGEADYDGVQDDVRRMLEYALSLSDKLVVFGQSLGGALTIYGVSSLEAREHIRGVIIESAFSSYRAIAQEKIGGTWLGYLVQLPLSYLVRDTYSPLKKVASISPIPLLFVHGENDEIVPFHHSLKLFEAAKEPKKLITIPQGSHISSAGYEAARHEILDFLAEVTATAAQ